MSCDTGVIRVEKSIISIKDRERHHDIHLLLRKVGEEQRGFFVRLRASAFNQKKYGRLTLSNFISVRSN